MPHVIDSFALLPSSPGTHRAVKVHRFGEGVAGPRVYVQAALHANETPGLLILHHLLRMVIDADKAGRVRGAIVLVPYANPIGLSDNVLGNQVGREALDGSGNYNRGWPDLGKAVVPRLAGRLGTDPAANRALIRSELRALVEALPAPNEVVSLQRGLLRESIEADYVIDVHTELAAVPAMVVAPWSLPAMEPLIDEIAPDVVHVTDTPLLFDFVNSKPWFDIAAAYPEAAVEQGCVSATVELRGVSDVDDALAARDAAAIYRTLVHIGAIEEPVEAPMPWSGSKTPHESILMQRTPVGGVIVYRHPLGIRVAKGDVVADIVDPAADDPAAARTPILAAREGMLYAYILNHLVRPNDIVVKIAGSEVWTPGEGA